MERVVGEQLRELEVVGNASRVFEALIEVVARPGHRHVVPEFVAQLRDLTERVSQARFRARHADVVPHDSPELAMNLADAAGAFD
jgi:hypothetical protein